MAVDDDRKGGRKSVDGPPSFSTGLGKIGKYVLLERIAVGGMAEVFRAAPPRLASSNETQPTVVIKRMLPGKSELENQEIQGYFQLENTVGQTLTHPNLVRVFEMGHEGGLPYLVLEDVRGVDLWRFLRWLNRNKRTLDSELALFVATQLLRGLHAFHEAQTSDGKSLNLVHRDVSPSNVLLGLDGTIKLADYGIARGMERTRESSSHTKGKLGYLSPEQVEGNDASRKSDLFAAATIAAELLMGRHLFSGGSELAVLLAIRDANIQPFIEFAVRLPEGLTATLCAALQRSPELRPASAELLAEELEVFAKRPKNRQALLLSSLVREASSSRAGNVAALDVVLPPAEARTFDPDAPPITADLALPDFEKTPRQGDDTWPYADAAYARNDVVTQDQPALLYSVSTHDGKKLGPFSYAQLVEAMATSRVAASDRVALGHGEYRPVEEVTELHRHLPFFALTGRTREQGEVKGADAVYELSEVGILRAMVRAMVHEETGLLLCDHNGVRKEVYLERGVPEFVSSNLASELLGEYLIAHKIISRAELDMALAVMPRFDGRLGDTLAALGLVDAVTLFRHIAHQVREKLVELYLWNRGKALFYAGVPKPTSGFPLGLDPMMMLADGIEKRLGAGILDLHAFIPENSKVIADTKPIKNVHKLRGQLPPTARMLLENLVVPLPLAALWIGKPEREQVRVRRDVTLLAALGMIAPA